MHLLVPELLNYLIRLSLSVCSFILKRADYAVLDDIYSSPLEKKKKNGLKILRLEIQFFRPN